MTYLWFDFETFLIQPAIQAPPVVCVSFAIDDGPAQLLHSGDPRFAALLFAAVSSDAIMVAHNAAGFEVPVMLANFPWLRRRLFKKLRAGQISDTQIRERLLRIGKGDPREGFGLQDCLNAHCIPIKLKKDSPWRVRYGTLYNTPVEQWPQDAVDYSLGDVAVRNVWKAQQRQGEEFFVNEAAQVEAAVALQLSSCWGMTTDREQADKLIAATEADIARDLRLLVREGLIRFEGQWPEPVRNLDVARERIEAAYAKLGKPAPRGDITEKMADKGATEGNISTDEDACLGTGDPALAAFTRYGQANTLLNKVRRLRHPIIQASYNVLVNTGRTSCRQGDDPKPGEPYSAHGTQVQNPPRKEGVRECFVARPGTAIVSIDFDTFELRSWSQVCLDLLGYSEMAKVLRDPTRDVHVELGSAVYDLTPAQAYALKKTDKKMFKDLRQVAKALNFGCPGGLGARTFVEYAKQDPYNLDLTEERAKDLIQIWRDTWPEARGYLDYISDRLGKRGSRGTIVHLRSKRIRGDVGFCDMANSYFQGLAADAAKAGFVGLMYEFYDRPESPIYGCRMLGFLHDEVLLECPLDRLHETAHYARDVFVAGAQKWIPDVPLTASPAAMLRWSKVAGDPVFDAQGKLIPWEFREAA